MAVESVKSNLVACLRIKAGKTDQFNQLTEELIGRSRNEAGVITHKLFKNMEDDNEFLFFEEYVDQ